MASPLVQEAVRRYHDLLGSRHLASSREVLDRYGDRTDCNVLRPHFIDQEQYAEILSATELICRALDVAAERLARDSALRRKLGIPEYVDALLELDQEHGEPSLMGRFDGIVDRGGVFRVFEYNSVPSFDNAGLAAEAFGEMPIMRDFRELYHFRAESLFDLAADTLIAEHARSGREGKPTIGVPFTAEEGPGEIPAWLARVEARGCKVVVAPYEAFRFEGGRLVASAAPIDMVLPRQSDLLSRIGSASPIFDAIRARAVRLVFGLSRGFLASYKNTFQLLSDPEYASLFEAEVARALTRHVPWTRVLRNGPTTHRGLRVDLLPFLVQNREHMVLKPSGGRLGTDIVLGWRCTDAVWKQALKRALGRSYVAQERVVAVSEPYAKRAGDALALQSASATFEPFVWHGRARGALARISESGVHNLADGCSMAPVWVLERAAG